VLFTLEQPYGNHNGGQIAFGPDGHLYLGLGDGGSGGDPLNAGQDLGTPLGAILRFDVDAGGPGDLRVPADNPFVGVAGARPRSGRTACATPGASPSTRAPATCGSPTSARTRSRRSTCSPPTAAAARTTAGASSRATAASTRRRAATSAPRGAGRHLHPRLGLGPLDHRRGVRALRRRRAVAARALPVRRLRQRPRVRGRRRRRAGFTARPLLDAGFGIATFGLDEALDAYLADYGGGVLYRFED
jgi:hypothetical protein